MKRIKWLRWTILLCLTPLASGCATSRTGIEYCEHAKPIYWNSDAELQSTPLPITRQIVESNSKIKRLCG